MSKGHAVILVLMGAVFMSFTGIFMRLIDSAGGFQILFYRSFSMVCMLGLLVCVRRRMSPLRLVISLDSQDLAIGFALSVAFTAFVFAILFTSVASTLFILTATPLIAASIAWVWIREKPHPFTWVAMTFAACGVFLMLGDGLSNGRIGGNLLALVSAIAFSIMLTIARKGEKTDILGGTFVAGALAGLYGLLFSLTVSNGLAVSRDDLLIILAMGAFAIGLGIGLVTWGTPYIPAAEVSVLVLLESVLGPLWVWLLNFEVVTRLELAGGGIVFLSVVILSAVTGRKSLAVRSIWNK